MVSHNNEFRRTSFTSTPFLAAPSRKTRFSKTSLSTVAAVTSAAPLRGPKALALAVSLALLQIASIPSAMAQEETPPDLPIFDGNDGNGGDDPRRDSPPRNGLESDPITEEVSPVRRIRGNRNRDIGLAAFDAPLDRPSIDGLDNNIQNASMNATHEALARWLPSDYADAVSAMAGENRPNPRDISNGIFAQVELIPNDAGLTDFFWQWGQFLDHDIDLTDGTNPPEPADIQIPEGDELFDPFGSGEVTLRFNRSLYDSSTGTSAENPREQVNEITGWIDASNVYGSDAERAETLRAMDGSGRLRMSRGRLLPFDEGDADNAGGDTPRLFIAGDVRANEQVGLTAMHTLFVREHNRIADRIRRDNSGMSGEAIYQQARAQVTAYMQIITYKEFVPRLLGEDAMPAYEGYDPTVDARIMNSFSTGAFRLGHSLLSPQILRLNADGSEHEAGHLPLRDAFFAPDEITENGIEPVLRGLAGQVCQQLDSLIIDDVRNFLFGIPGAGGFDLASLNIQRGRDHGLPSYNVARRAAGLPPARGFFDISRDPEVRAQLRDTYGSINDIDLWVGGLAESHVPGAQVGPLFHAILLRQFVALRDGDRFWYENRYNEEAVAILEQTRLSDIIRRNTHIDDELPDDVFVAATEDSPETIPEPREVVPPFGP